MERWHSDGALFPIEVYAVGSAAQFASMNEDHPLNEIVQKMPGARYPAKEFLSAHWYEIEIVATALIDRRDLSPEDVAGLLAH